MIYVCDEHEVAFTKETSARTHWNFQHGKGDTWSSVDKEAIMREELPDGFVLKSVPVREATKVQPQGEKTPITPAVPKPDLTEDPEAERLEKMLRSLGVPDNEINRIVNGFVNIPRIREDANYLSHWLDTHIRADKALKAYIPMIVGEVLGGNTVPVPLPGTGFDGGGARYFTPHGYPPNYPWGQSSAYYPSVQQEPETTRRIEELNKRFDSLLVVFQEDRQSRARENQEREQREREQTINTKIDKVQETVLAFIQAQNSSGKSDLAQKTEGQIADLMTEIKELRTDQQTQMLKTVLDEVATLRQAVATSKGETVGRSTEDLVHDIGPLALDKIDKMGERIGGELKGLREQMGPTVKEAIEKGAEGPRTIEQIEDQVNTENNVLNLVGRTQEEVQVIVDDTPPQGVSPQEEPSTEAYARMPNPSRRRRDRRGGVENDEVSGASTPTGTP